MGQVNRTFPGIYDAVRKELDYQETRNNGEIVSADPTRSLADWLLYIEAHLNKAKQDLYDLDEFAATCEIRKIMALGFRSGQYFGTPSRELEMEYRTGRPDAPFEAGPSTIVPISKF